MGNHFQAHRCTGHIVKRAAVDHSWILLFGLLCVWIRTAHCCIAAECRRIGLCVTYMSYSWQHTIMSFKNERMNASHEWNQ